LAVGATSNGDGRSKVFALSGRDNSVWHRWQTSPGVRSSSNSNICNATNNGKTTIHSKMLIAENKHQLSKTISLAEKDVKESNVIKVTRSELKPCDNSEIKLYTARLDYLAEKQDDKE
jgi:NADH:ubiquinone oxidoreductase subunit F (NADH-binding)